MNNPIHVARLVKKGVKKLPKKFQGADVVRGLGMKGDKFDDLLDSFALDQFDATRETYLVVENNALDVSTVVRCFENQDAAIRCARALAHGNVDHRVLRVSGQTLVVAADNEL